jgi:hypothetical protein
VKGLEILMKYQVCGFMGGHFHGVHCAAERAEATRSRI